MESSNSVKEEQMRAFAEERKRRGAVDEREVERSQRGVGDPPVSHLVPPGRDPPVSAFHVPPKTGQGVNEVRGECEGGEERVELESERGNNPKQRRKEEEEEEEAVIEEELGSIVHDMQVSSWTEGTHI